MSSTANGVCELLPTKTCDLYGPRSQRGDSRTSLKAYFLDPVLPLLALLSMSALTVVMLVVIVTTVADMDLQLPGGYVGVDPWSGWEVGPVAGSYQDQAAYPDSVAFPESLDERESRPVAQTGNPF
ncbi:MAG: hypothetical protein MUC88_17130 [Planctomycetes bacterium]|jgi:hypothetical protein|nr:hypothetical protein [Planctomycetota bacterium]